MTGYNPQKIEKKWQKIWEKNKIFNASDRSKKPKFYVLVEFPYPSGDGLHVGHVRSYAALDAVARKKRMDGYNVLFPIGWDAFGLPAENYAIKTGIHPSITVKENIANYKRQLKSLGLSFDWQREINTTDPKYYKWTQWIFLKLFKNGLAYQAKMSINWCPSCKIGLANEEVISGKCERCGTVIEQRKMKQWMLKITEYAERLIKDLDKVNYLKKIKTQQINWIGKSFGAEADFKLSDSNLPASATPKALQAGKKISVFTTRIDTIFGVTAVVLAPENPLIPEITTKENEGSVKEYIKQSKLKNEFERIKLEKEKTGVFTGAYCINPANGEKIPIWVGDYVVATYGGGAVMTVPAHDSRDYQFAKKYNLGIKEVVAGGKTENGAFTECGVLINSKEFNGLPSEEAIEKITQWLERNKAGRKTIQYKLRDWVFSRQHYWGEPIPIIHCKKCGSVPVPEKDLPVKLPFVKKYQPAGTGESPLAAIKEWVNVKCPKCGGAGQRETDTMPNWAGSSWYFMRYIDPKNNKKIVDPEKLKYWMPVDLYNGGMEHTTLHLLYSRFWYKFLYDIKVAPQSEPYGKRISHGIVLAADGRKMSKSWGNVINPDNVVEEYGADTLRLYEMFMGPFDQMIAWNEQGIKGCRRFLERVYNLTKENSKENSKQTGADSQEIKKLLHKTIKKVSEDIEAMKFNTAISSLMEFVNFWQNDINGMGEEEISKFLIILSPFAPHLAEELWEKAGFKGLCCQQKWPGYNPKLIKEEKTILIIQINGKIRDKIEVEAGISEELAKKTALASGKIRNWLEGKEIKKVIFVVGKLINIVAVDKK